MGFYLQNKQNQRSIERFVMILFSLYTVNLCIGNIRGGISAWISVVMSAALAAAWIIYFDRRKTFRVRAVFTTVMIQITVVVCAVSTEDKVALLPTFMVMTILVSLYGMGELLWLTLLTAFFVVFYHGIITDTFELASWDTLSYLLPQLGNVFCMELVLHTWLKNRNESNAQMYEMIEALVEAEQSKDDFLSNVSHEIRTPVNTICGMSEMALREHDPDKMRQEVFDIRDAGHNLMSLVSDILDFSQLQQGKMNLEEEVYNITSTINDIINVAMARKGAKPIELIVDCAADIPNTLLGDEKKIRRVIMNLADNAIKFTNNGGVMISVSARRESYGINLCISVKDTGIGISEENLEKLFESFSQVDTRRNRQEGGVGLGLAISRALVMKMGGTLTVHSKLGKGSEFLFVVPQKVLKEEPIGRLVHRERLNIAAYFDMEQFDMMSIRDEYTKLIAHMVRQLQVKCHACRNLAELKRRESMEPFSHIFISLEEYQEDEPYFDRLAKETKVIAVIERYNEKYISSPDIIRLYKPFYILPVISILNGSTDSEGGMQMVRPGKFIAPGVHALVVDDNRMNIRVVEGLLKEYQIKVSYATSGQEALQLIECMCYDFVFMDHMMPEMDGVETLHRIRDKVGNYYQRVPVIALTANAAPGNREMFLGEGFNDFVAKPVELSVLERVLRRNLPEEKLIFPKKEDWERAAEGDVEAEAGQTVQDTVGTEAGQTVQDTVGTEASRTIPDAGRKAGTGREKEKAFAVGDLDVGQGMLYCGGKEKYLNILKTYQEEGEEHCLLLERLYDRQDWKNYTIKVHALKSTMHSIGAGPLAAMAKSLEMAGKSGDYAFILEHHRAMVEEHARVMEELRQCPLLAAGGQAYLGQVMAASGQDIASRKVFFQNGKQPALEDGQPPIGKNVHGDTEEGMGKNEQQYTKADHLGSEHKKLPELDEETFDRLSAEMEDAMYLLDGGHMLEILSQMEGYRYGQAALVEKLAPIRKKIERSDYMSAVDAISQLRRQLKMESTQSMDIQPGEVNQAEETLQSGEVSQASEYVQSRDRSQGVERIEDTEYTENENATKENLREGGACKE